MRTDCDEEKRGNMIVLVLTLNATGTFLGSIVYFVAPEMPSPSQKWGWSVGCPSVALWCHPGKAMDFPSKLLKATRILSLWHVRVTFGIPHSPWNQYLDDRWRYLLFVNHFLSIVRQKKLISDFQDLNQGTKSCLQSLRHSTSSPPTPSEAINFIYHPTCRRAVWVAKSLWRQLTQRCRLLFLLR